MDKIRKSLGINKLATLLGSLLSNPFMITLIIVAIILISNAALLAGDGSGVSVSGSGMN